MKWRASARCVVERLLLASGLPGLLARSRRGRRLVLAYHNIVPPGETAAGDRSLHLPLGRFEQQLDLLATACAVRPLHEVLAGTAGETDRPVVAITFDDAYAGAVRHGLAALVRRGLPATVFVAPAFLGGAGFWWDALANPGVGGLSADTRAVALDRCRGRDAEVRDWVPASGLSWREPPPWMRCADEAELVEAGGWPGISLGSHTWSHPNLTRLTPAELGEELSRPRQWLAERGHHAPSVISYPYGLSNASVRVAAAAAGYRWGLHVTGGWLGPPSESLGLPRLNIPAGLSPEGLSLRLSGLWAE